MGSNLQKPAPISSLQKKGLRSPLPQEYFGVWSQKFERQEHLKLLPVHQPQGMGLVGVSLKRLRNQNRPGDQQQY